NVNNWQTFSAIVFGDHPSLKQSNTKRLEIFRANNAMRSNRNLIWVRGWPTLDIKDCVERNFSLKRNICCGPGCNYPRQVANAFQYLIGKRASRAVLRVFLIRQYHFHGQEIVGFESKVDVLQPMETSNHQSTANEQGQRNRNLGHDQCIEPAPTGRGAATALIALLDARNQLIRAGAFQRRD